MLGPGGPARHTGSRGISPPMACWPAPGRLIGNTMFETIKRIFVGRPLATSEQEHQRLTKTVALAVFSSDAISSTAYATRGDPLRHRGGYGDEPPTRPRPPRPDRHRRRAAVAVHVQFVLLLLAETGLDAMTGCRIKRIEDYVDGENFCLTYGDGLSDQNLAELWNFHLQHGRIGTVTSVLPPGRFGELTLDGPKIVEFCEKPLPRIAA